ncbi:3-oxoacyl-[acyl-carrier-protein] synthase 3 [Pseudovibrio sp. W64]|uniref:3-oxoacyl-[acyl-carrier-protein] synthase III C-terminal domain-containing protein n=1 Tax=Pseudovibrio TaxID=258255 RepID=UPI0007AE6806|nr:3-oxoacyl-[acyl-carrier-protein] synthase III C-terminal domain-containing protein [Pseudovibrio sp. W64]KZK81522.1 3-oxoacyl-[acyl-carrier-protein] synthase 3 [Pseudovibrio sp. W64]
MLDVLDFEIALPDRVETMVDISSDLSLSQNQIRMFTRFFGFDQFHCDHDGTLQQLAGDACAKLLNRNQTLDDHLSHVIHCHTLPSNWIVSSTTSPTLAPFYERGIEVFSASMNHCATGISMLDTLDQLLGEDDVGLILIADKAFHPDIRVIENITIMGEAAAAILVARRPGRYRVKGSYTHHETRFWQNSGHKNEGFLEGFGNGYMDFACSALDGALAHFGVDWDDISYVLPHNVNLTSWYQIGDRLGIQREKLCLSTVSQYGHCFGADPFINLQHTIAMNALKRHDLVLLISVGLGATASTALIQMG